MSKEDEQKTSARMALLLSVGLMCVGGALRAYNYWLPGLWIDEYGTWWVVGADSWSEAINRAIQVQGQSPFYYVIVRLFTELFGYNSFALRLPSLLLGIATLTLVYPLAQVLFHRRDVAVLSVGVFALSERLIWYSQNARPYSLGLFLSLLSFWFFLAILRRDKQGDRIGYALTAAALFYAHYLYGFVIIIQVCYLVLEKGWRHAASKSWLLTFALIVILTVPMVTQLGDLFNRRHTLDWIPAMAWFRPILVAIKLVLGSFHPWVVALTALAVLVVGFDRHSLARPTVRRNLKLPLLWLAIPFAVFMFLPKILGITLFETRYMLFAYPAVFFLMAWSMANLRLNDWRRWIPPCVFVISTTVFTAAPAMRTTQTFSYWDRWRWPDAGMILAHAYQPSDIIILRTGLVEADQAAHIKHNASFASYVNWALLANLPDQKRYKIAILPFRLSDANRDYFASLQMTATKHRRVWLVGDGELVNLFRRKLTLESGYQVVSQPLQGRVQVFLLMRPASIP